MCGDSEVLLAQDVLHSQGGTFEAFLWAVRLASLACVCHQGCVCRGPLSAGSRGRTVSVQIRGRCRLQNQVVKGKWGPRHRLPYVAIKLLHSEILVGQALLLRLCLV